MKTSTFRERQTVTIHSPRARVWEYAMDLAKITEYNPRVARVEPGSGEGKRAAGVSYRCHLVGGAHCCTEEDMEIVPMERLVTRMVDDTLGLTARLKDYTVETTLTELDARTTRVMMSHVYSTPTLGSHLLNWLARDKISRNTEATLLMLKAQIESATEDGARQAMDLLRRPALVSAIAVFFVVAAILSLVVGAALVAPSSPLAEVLRMKPQAQFAFASLGAWRGANARTRDPYVADCAGSVGRDPVGLAARILWARSKCRARPHPHTHVRAARSDRDSRRGSGAVLPDAQKRPPMVLAGLSVAGVAIGTSAMLKSSLLRSSSTRNASS